MNRSILARAAALVLLAFVAGTVAGCGRAYPKTYEVSGTVTFGNGAPVRFGMVEFRSEETGITAKGQISLDGTFQLGTRTTGDGAAAGPYRAIVVQYIPALTSKPTKTDYHDWQDETERSPHRVTGVVDTKFSDYSTSGLRFVVSESKENQCKLVVTGLPGSTDLTSGSAEDQQCDESSARCPYHQ